MASTSRESSKKRWQRASYVASNAVAFSKTFHTLRDMVPDVYIDPTQLVRVKSLGEGAFATVVLCSLNERLVAVKYLKPSLLQSDRDLNDFLKEAALLKKLSHPAVVQFVGVAIETEDDRGDNAKRSFAKKALQSLKSMLTMKKALNAVGFETPFEARSDLEAKSDASKSDLEAELESTTGRTEEMSVPLRNVMLVQEYMTRGTFKGLLLEQMEHIMKPIYTRSQALEWLIQIAQGLGYLHDSRPKIIHRDLKLENLMLTLDSDDRVVAKLGDFGLHAVLKEPKRAYETNHNGNDEHIEMHSSGASLSKSRRGRCCSVKANYELSGKTGSLMYMAPEVLRCQPYNEKADVFSFALIMYELFCKSILLCFVSCTGEPDEIEKWAHNIARGNRPAVPDDWPPELKTLVRHCWNQTPSNRPSMSEIIHRLKQLRQHPWIDADDKPRAVNCCCHQ